MLLLPQFKDLFLSNTSLLEKTKKKSNLILRKLLVVFFIAFGSSLILSSNALAERIADTVTDNGPPSTGLLINVSCGSDSSVTSDGSTAGPGGYCPIAPVDSAFSITYTFNSPDVDEFYESIAVWANAGGVYNDGELRTFDITINYLDIAGNPQSISGNVDIGDTLDINDPKFVTPASIGGPSDISGISSFTISNLTSDVTEAAFREVALIEATPELAVVKTSVANAGSDNIFNAGDTITYTYVVTNTGLSTIFNVSVSELGGASFTGTNAVPVPNYLSGGSDYDTGGTTTDIRSGESVTFQASYVISDADINVGQVTNQATASGTDFHGASTTDTSGTANNNDDVTITSILSAPEPTSVPTLSEWTMIFLCIMLMGVGLLKSRRVN